jgi:hypothetical protein
MLESCGDVIFSWQAPQPEGLFSTGILAAMAAACNTGSSLIVEHRLTAKPWLFWNKPGDVEWSPSTQRHCGSD